MPRSTQVSGWCFTWNNPAADVDPATLFSSVPSALQDRLRYAVWQLECGEQGTFHIQGYVEFKRSVTFGSAVKILPTGVHFEPRQGSREQARDYCMKADTRSAGPWEFGLWVPGGRGRRSDIEEMFEMVKEGKSELDVAESHPGSWAHAYRALQHYRILLPPPPRLTLEVILHYGPPGVGKSWDAMYENGQLRPSTAMYVKSPGKWWDGYSGQSIVVMDDFSGWLPYPDLLRVLDRYPLRVEVKGGSVPFVATTIFVTSMQKLTSWYPYKNQEELKAVTRRFTKFIVYESLNHKQEFLDWFSFARETCSYID